MFSVLTFLTFPINLLWNFLTILTCFVFLHVMFKISLSNFKNACFYFYLK